MVETIDLIEYLSDRGARYGISADELFAAIPDSVKATPEAALEWVKLKDISHIEPLSHGGESAGDNWFFEDSSVNRSRGAETATESEQQAAAEDGERDAQEVLKFAARVAAGQAASATVTAVGVVPAAAIGLSIYAFYRQVKCEKARTDNPAMGPEGSSQWVIYGQATPHQSSTWVGATKRVAVRNLLGIYSPVLAS